MNDGAFYRVYCRYFMLKDPLLDVYLALNTEYYLCLIA
ncbi:DUF4753 domain-containing protein [Kosakonia cowanii]|nr:DUF4753 domain-containing protein [Kosakonia cowanii]